MALRHLYEETLDINFNDKSALLATRMRRYVGGSLTDLSLNTAEGSRSEAAVFVYGDPIRKAQLRVLDKHLAAAKHGSLRLQKISPATATIPHTNR